MKVDTRVERQNNPSAVPPLRVSVAMATYNGEKYIREQLDSIARQTLLPCELVITDDGSTDATLTVAAEFAREAPFPVRIHRNPERLGYADNFLRAASLCEGDLIAFCDQDDIWMEWKLATCAAFFADNQVLLVSHSARTLNADGHYGHQFPRFYRTRTQRRRDPFENRPGFSMVVRRNVLALTEGVERPERLRSHDHWIWFLAASAGSIATIARPLVIYRQHDKNVFGVPSAQSLLLRTRRVTATLEYETKAQLEDFCASLLRAIAGRNLWCAGRLDETAHALQRLAAFHRLRTRIYANRSGFSLRMVTYGMILLRGGYCQNASRTRLGPKAGLKDLVFGVTGALRKAMS